MKKIYLPCAALLLGGALSAQPSGFQAPLYPGLKSVQRAHEVKPGNNFSAAQQRDTIWSEDFDGASIVDGLPEGWTQEVIGISECQWEWTDVGHQGEYPTQSIESSTASNGWMILDSDNCNFQGGGTEDAALISPVIDLSDNPDVAVEFEQMMREFAADVCLIGFSTNGVDWVEVEINNGIGQAGTPNPDLVYLNATDYIGGSSTAQVRIRWQGQWDYGWQIDDLRIVEAIANDMRIVETFATNHEVAYNDPDVTTLDYWFTLDYNSLPVTQPREHSPTARVVNQGANPATDVVLTVNITGPAGFDETLSSAPIDLDPQESAYITIPINLFADGDPALGEYVFSYEVSMAEEDLNPSNDVGDVRVVNITDDEWANEDGILQSIGTDGENAIYGATFSVTQEQTVTHIGFVMANPGDPTLGETVPGEIIFLNIRKGSPLAEADETNPQELIYGDEEISYVIEESDISSGETVWVWVELPEPLTLEEGFVYSPEVHLPSVGFNICFIGQRGQQEDYCGSVYVGAESTWYFTGDRTPMIRLANFGPQSVVSRELAGVKLGQNFPNPATATTRVMYNLEAATDVTFEIVDMTGKIVVREYLGNLPAGEYIKDINTSGWANGLYEYSLYNQNGRVSRTMSVIK